MTHYFLLLQDSANTQEPASLLGPSTEPMFSVGSSSIKENARYSYRIEAVNNINISSQTAEQIFCKSLTDFQVLHSRLYTYIYLSLYIHYHCTTRHYRCTDAYCKRNCKLSCGVMQVYSRKSKQRVSCKAH